MTTIARRRVHRFSSLSCVIVVVHLHRHVCHPSASSCSCASSWSSPLRGILAMVVLPSCRAGGGCVVVLECGRRIMVVVVEPIIGCHVIESDDVAPGSVVNNNVRGGNGDLLRIETTNNDYVVVRHLPRRCQRHGTLDSVVYSWPVIVHWVTWRCHVICVVVVMGDRCGWWPMVTVTTM